MFSYVVAILAALVFLSNPIANYFYPETALVRRNFSPPPKLNESLLAINKPNDTNPQCPPDTYVAHVLKSQPLVIYLENFLSVNDRKHLLDIRFVRCFWS